MNNCQTYVNLYLRLYEDVGRGVHELPTGARDLTKSNA